MRHSVRKALKVLFEAFDDAWKSIEGNFGGDAAAVEAARTRLANTVLAIARDGVSDPVDDQECRAASDRAGLQG